MIKITKLEMESDEVDLAPGGMIYFPETYSRKEPAKEIFGVPEMITALPLLLGM